MRPCEDSRIRDKPACWRRRYIVSPSPTPMQGCREDEGGEMVSVLLSAGWSGDLNIFVSVWDGGSAAVQRNPLFDALKQEIARMKAA
jgi:hypothetical protein